MENNGYIKMCIQWITVGNESELGLHAAQMQMDITDTIFHKNFKTRIYTWYDFNDIKFTNRLQELLKGACGVAKL